MTEEKIKYLEFIQNIVTRMNQNSFMIKGWTVAIVSALLAVYAGKENKLFILISIFPVFIFMFLDSYYLWQERKFRHLYSKALDEDESQKVKLFSMNTNVKFEINVANALLPKKAIIESHENFSYMPEMTFEADLKRFEKVNVEAFLLQCGFKKTEDWNCEKACFEEKFR